MALLEVHHFPATRRLIRETDPHDPWYEYFSAQVYATAGQVIYGIDPKEIRAHEMTARPPVIGSAAGHSALATEVTVSIEHKELSKMIARGKLRPEMAEMEGEEEATPERLLLAQFSLDIGHLVLASEIVTEHIAPHVGGLLTAENSTFWPKTILHSGWTAPETEELALQQDGGLWLFNLAEE